MSIFRYVSLDVSQMCFQFLVAGVGVCLCVFAKYVLDVFAHSSSKTNE